VYLVKEADLDQAALDYVRSFIPETFNAGSLVDRQEIIRAILADFEIEVS